MDRVLEDSAGAGLLVGDCDLAGGAGGVGPEGEGGTGFVDAVVATGWKAK